jgi:hypothetical protein
VCSSDLAVDAGAILILYGSAKGLTAKGDQIWHEDSPGIKGVAEANDNLATSLVTGDFDKDGFHDLAIGASREGIGIIDQAGAVHVLYGSAGGLTAAGDQLWHQDKTGIKGAAGDFDRFGNSLTTGDFDNDGFHDLAVGIPFEDISTVNNAGAVEVLYGSRRGLRAKGDQLWHQDTPGIKDVAEDGDSFGSQVSVGDFDGDGFDDLVAAAGGELTTTIFRDGMVHVIHGSAKGLRPKGDQIWHQDTPGIKEVNDRDGFGAALP